jgi:catechol 2,3-dioxygenase-like lactoylglutathione lyase family enzyme
MIRIREIDHLVLRVIDLDKMLHFYCNVLGCAIEQRNDVIGLVQLRAGEGRPQPRSFLFSRREMAPREPDLPFTSWIRRAMLSSSRGRRPVKLRQAPHRRRVVLATFVRYHHHR